MEKSIYVGNAKGIKNKQGEIFGYKLNIDLTVINENREFITEWTDKHGKTHEQIVIDCFPLKPENVTEYKTHSVKINTWKPEKANKQESQASDSDDDLPF